MPLKLLAPPTQPLRWWGPQGSTFGARPTCQLLYIAQQCLRMRDSGPIVVRPPTNDNTSKIYLLLQTTTANTTPQLPSSPNTMSELTSVKETPRWVTELSSPPPFRSKANGISDPPGYPSQASTSSKVRANSYLSSASIANIFVVYRRRTHRKTPKPRENNRRRKRWIL